MKKILIGILIISIFLEGYLTFLAFFKPAALLSGMELTYSDSLKLPVFLIAWFLLLITMLIGYLIHAAVNNLPEYKSLIYLLSFWWIGIGIAIYFYSGLTSNLVSDSLKGVLLIVFTAANKK